MTARIKKELIDPRIEAVSVEKIIPPKLFRDVKNSLCIDPGRSDKEKEIIALLEVS